MANSTGTLAMPREYFSVRDAERIYAGAVHFVESFSCTRDVASFYEMSALQLRHPGHP